MALRRSLEAHFEHFWAQLAKFLSECLWRLILSISGPSWPNGFQKASGGSFSAFLGPAGRVALRKPLEAHFEHFWAQLAKWLSEGLWRLILSISGPRTGQMALRRPLEAHFEHFWTLCVSVRGLHSRAWPERLLPIASQLHSSEQTTENKEMLEKAETR